MERLSSLGLRGDGEGQRGFSGADRLCWQRLSPSLPPFSAGRGRAPQEGWMDGGVCMRVVETVASLCLSDGLGRKSRGREAGHVPRAAGKMMGTSSKVPIQSSSLGQPKPGVSVRAPMYGEDPIALAPVETQAGHSQHLRRWGQTLLLGIATKGTGQNHLGRLRSGLLRCASGVTRLERIGYLGGGGWRLQILLAVTIQPP